MPIALSSRFSVRLIASLVAALLLIFITAINLQAASMSPASHPTDHAASTRDVERLVHYPVG